MLNLSTKFYKEMGGKMAYFILLLLFSFSAPSLAIASHDQENIINWLDDFKTYDIGNNTPSSHSPSNEQSPYNGFNSFSPRNSFSNEQPVKIIRSQIIEKNNQPTNQQFNFVNKQFVRKTTQQSENQNSFPRGNIYPPISPKPNHVLRPVFIENKYPEFEKEVEFQRPNPIQRNPIKNTSRSNFVRQSGRQNTNFSQNMPTLLPLNSFEGHSYDINSTIPNEFMGQKPAPLKNTDIPKQSMRQSPNLIEREKLNSVCECYGNNPFTDRYRNMAPWDWAFSEINAKRLYEIGFEFNCEDQLFLRQDKYQPKELTQTSKIFSPCIKRPIIIVDLTEDNQHKNNPQNSVMQTVDPTSVFHQNYEPKGVNELTLIETTNKPKKTKGFRKPRPKRKTHSSKRVSSRNAKKHKKKLKKSKTKNVFFQVVEKVFRLMLNDDDAGYRKSFETAKKSEFVKRSVVQLPELESNTLEGILKSIVMGFKNKDIYKLLSSCRNRKAIVAKLRTFLKTYFKVPTTVKLAALSLRSKAKKTETYNDFKSRVIQNARNYYPVYGSFTTSSFQEAIRHSLEGFDVFKYFPQYYPNLMKLLNDIKNKSVSETANNQERELE